MSGQGAPDLRVDATGMRVAIVAGSWHQEATEAMIADALATVESAGASADVYRVAGSFELPLGAQAAATAAVGYDAVVCLGVIIRGGTPHFDYVCNAVTDGLTRVQLDTGKPIGFGVLTTDNEEQAFQRSGLPGAAEAKGREAAEAALHLAVTQRQIAAAG
ncbi:6,7-dimethyl-8-ribityllumazine synthase [Canibacter zhoujuaniae]|uniref:6,7-dimethyl-8-ribityllumazine synthase n=1 Tax=Canibacter zhoujuaniae TaxID=2708343 RepID=UPI00141DF541|nr:6,7-dimethyl-8-ribityllumazine synthase [Canibacter zhoujuaniae]